MNFKATIALLLLVAAGGYLWWRVEIEGGPRPDPADELDGPAEPAAVVADAPELAAIERVTLQVGERAAMSFERRGPNEWEMTAPLPADVEGYMIDGLARKCLNLQSQGVADGVAPADAGLSPPRAVLTLVTDADASYVFELGGTVGLSKEHFVRVTAGDAGPVLHEVATNFDAELERAPADYRAKRVVTVSNASTLGLTFEHQGETYRLTRPSGRDSWTFAAPLEAAANDQKINAAISALGTLRVTEFVSDSAADLAKFGLADPWLSLQMTVEQETPAPESEDETGPPPAPETTRAEIGLAIGDFADFEQQSRYLRRSDREWVARVPVASLEKLIPNFKDWRDNRLVRFAAAEVAALTLYEGQEGFELQRADGVWSGSGDLADVDQARVAELLEAIDALRAIDYVDDPGDPAEYGLASPRARVRLQFTGNEQPLELAVGGVTPSGRNAYVRVAGHRSVYVVTEAQAERVALSPLAMRSPQVFTVNADAIERVEQTVGDAVRVAEQTADGWRLVSPEGAPLDETALTGLRRDIARLRATQVVGRDEDLADYGLDAPYATIRFAVAEVEAESAAADGAPATEPAEADAAPDGPAATPADPNGAAPVAPDEPAATAAAEEALLTLQLGRAGDAVYALRAGGRFVFELDPTLPPVLTAELIERRLWAVEAADVTYVGVAPGESELAFERQDDAWQYAVDPYVPIGQEAVSELVAVLTGLEVGRYRVWSGATVEDLGAVGSTVVLRTAAGEHTLQIAATGDVVRRPALWVERGRLFELDMTGLTLLSRTLDDYISE